MRFDPSLSPLLEAAPTIRVHTLVAIAAFGIGLRQFAAAKGTVRHRRVRWVWVGAMAVVALASLLIHEIRIWGAWSPIHFLTLLTLVGLWGAIRAARRGAIRLHRAIMISVFVGALVIAGGFALRPGRLLHATLFGPTAPIVTAAPRSP